MNQVINQLYAVALDLFQAGWHIANSNFTTALAGAGAGAYSAQWIVERRDKKRRLLEEIRSTNAAIIVAFEIINTFCAMKSQHVKRLKETFDDQRQKFDAFREKRRHGIVAPSEIFEFQADFETLPLPKNPTGVLQTLLFEKISVTGRPLSLFMTLSRCIDGFAGAVQQRERIIEWCKQHSPVEENILVPLYFGLPNRLGHTDRTYADSIHAIWSYTDDCIFFCKCVMDDLVKHGHQLAKLYGSTAPKINEPDFSKAVHQNLIPDDKQYADILTAFKSHNIKVDRSRLWLLKKGFARIRSLLGH